MLFLFHVKLRRNYKYHRYSVRVKLQISLNAVRVWKLIRQNLFAHEKRNKIKSKKKNYEKRKITNIAGKRIKRQISTIAIAIPRKVPRNEQLWTFLKHTLQRDNSSPFPRPLDKLISSRNDSLRKKKGAKRRNTEPWEASQRGLKRRKEREQAWTRGLWCLEVECHTRLLRPAGSRVNRLRPRRNLAEAVLGPLNGRCRLAHLLLETRTGRTIEEIEQRKRKEATEKDSSSPTTPHDPCLLRSTTGNLNERTYLCLSRAERGIILFREWN